MKFKTKATNLKSSEISTEFQIYQKDYKLFLQLVCSFMHLVLRFYSNILSHTDGDVDKLEI